MSGRNPQGSGADALGNAATVVDTRPSGDVKALESAKTTAVTPFESAGTAVVTPFESAGTAAVTPHGAGPLAADGIALRPFGPYSRVETLGQQGNMGVVARGYNQAFGRWELLKFLKPALAHDPELLRQFRREGRALARLAHPNVVQVFAMYDLDAQPCIAMEFLEGHSLTTELERAGGRLSQERAQELLLDAARGLAAAHELGLLHRDIKPDNLFVTLPGKGRVAGLKLIDFGLATADKARPEELQKDPSLASDATGGTPLFLAPELWQGRDPTPRTDLYALGVSFYFAVTGQFPCKDTALQTVVSYCASVAPAPRVAAERADLSPAFATLLDRLIDKSPSQRLESAEQLVAELSAQRAAARPRRVPGAGPYRGLSAFSESERDVFFGRERDIAEITERLRTQLGLLLVGPVACGKTSLARAGIVPAIRDGVLGGGHSFDAVLLEPRADPLRSLAGALAPQLQTPEAELLAELSGAPAQLRSLLERKLSPERGLLLVVDQLEQLADVPQAEALRFARALASLLEVESPRLRLLATVRSDVVDRLFAASALRGLLTRGFHPVGPLSAEDSQRALLEPAKIAGFSFENAEILAEAGTATQGSAAPLALASLALQRYWQLRDEPRRLLTRAAWASLGGVVGALLEHADAVWKSLGAGERVAAGDVVLRLISTRGARVSARRETLVDPASGGETAERALERLLASRLCVEVAGEVILVHDALSTVWPIAQELLASVGIDQQLRQRVSQAAQQWQEQNKPDGLLWAGEQAERLLAWFQGAEQSFTLLELEFVAAVEKQVTRSRRLRRAGGVAIALALVAVCSWLAVRDRRLSAELNRLRERSAAAQAAHASEAARLYADRAELRLLDAPSAALSDAQAAGRLLKNPALDPIAWQALTLGVPFGLPLHPGGASQVASDGEYIVSTGTEQLHSLRIQGAGAGTAAISRKNAEALANVSALALRGDAWLGTADGVIFRGRYRLPEPAAAGAPTGLELVRVGQAPGGVREIFFREASDRTFVCHVDGASMSLHALEPSALHPLWRGPARDLAVDAAGERLAIVTPEGELLTARLSAPGKLESWGQRSATSAVWLGSRVVVGTASGQLLLLDTSTQKEPQTSRFSVGGPIGRLFVSRAEQALVAQSTNGVAVVVSPALVELARVRLGAPPVRFLEAWRAVALVDDRQRVVVLGYDAGLELARFHGGGERISSVGSNDSWLLTTSLDGGVRAFSLTASLAKLFPPPGLPLLGSSVSALGVVAQLEPDRVSLRSNQPVVQPSATLTAEQRPATPSRLSVGAGAGWLQGQRSWAFWDRKQVSTGQVPRPIQLLLARQSSQALWLAVDGAAPGTSELTRARPGGAEPASPAFQGQALALAELGDGAGLALLPSQGPLRLTNELGSSKAEVELPAGPRSGALALSADGARFAIGYSAGTIAVGKLQKAAPQLYRVSRSPVTCIAFGRDERVLLVGDDQGAVRVLDLDTERTFPLFSAAAGPVQCGYDAARERFTFLDSRGNAWTRALDTTPLSFLPPVDAPLDSAEHTIARWRGLEAAPH